MSCMFRGADAGFMLRLLKAGREQSGSTLTIREMSDIWQDLIGWRMPERGKCFYIDKMARTMNALPPDAFAHP